MATFDFISFDQSRRSLERDAEELLACMQAGAWKAVHVLAGAIIQGSLIDYLGSTAGHEGERPLSMSFAELLDRCQETGVLSSRTAGLAKYLRSYADLIHPSLAVRTRETADENGARVAQALVEIVANEIASHRRGEPGLTAEQVVAKLHSDASAVSIIEHILRRIHAREMERLLLDVIPRAYLEMERLDDPQARRTLKDLERCYRLAFDLASEEVKRLAAKKYVSILEEESEHTVRCYESSFFSGGHMRFLEAGEREVVKAHFFASLERGLSMPLLAAAAGMGGFLDSVQEARAFFVPLVMGMLGAQDPELRAAIEDRLRQEFRLTSEENRQAVKRWINRLRRSLEQSGRTPAAEAAAQLYATI